MGRDRVIHLRGRRLYGGRPRRNIPGRKSDVKDAAWIADLLTHGLLRPSFVPPEKIQELRDGVQYRDLGPHHFDRDKQIQAARLLRRLKALGVEVTVRPAA